MHTARIALWVTLLACTLGIIKNAHAASWRDYQKPVHLSFKVDRQSVERGGSATLSWAASNAYYCYAQGDWKGRKSTTGTYRIKKLRGPVEFQLTCGNLRRRARERVVVDIARAAPTPPPAPKNEQPSVSAGLDQRITLPAIANLNGAASDDGLPNGNTEIHWRVLSGPGTVSLQDASQPTTQASFAKAGTYTLQLTVSDGALSASDNVQVIVSPETVNQAPQVNAGADLKLTLPDVAQLSGQISDDGLPNVSTQPRWQMVNGPGVVTFSASNNAQTTATFSTNGQYLLRLSASDGDLTSYDDVAIEVAAAQINTPPVVQAGPDQNVTLPQAISLRGRVSDDGSPGSGTSLRWSVASGPDAVDFSNATATDTAAAFVKEGTYVLRLSANDGELSTYDDVIVTVAEAVPPTVSLDVSETVIDVGEHIELSWRSEFADSCHAAGDWSGAQAVQGSLWVSPSEYATYSLRCTGAGQTATVVVSVLVRNLPLRWQAPTENVDGTPLTDLAGYRVYVISDNQYELADDIGSPTQTNTQLAMPSGEYNIAMTAYDLQGNESNYSNAVTKTSP